MERLEVVKDRETQYKRVVKDTKDTGKRTERGESQGLSIKFSTVKVE